MLDLFGFLLLLLPFAFFWAGCPCCDTLQNCGTWCPDGAPEQLQLTVPTDAYSGGAHENLECDESQCDERAGVRVLDLVPLADHGSYDVPQSGVPGDGSSCIWTSQDFTACIAYQDIGIIDPEYVLVTAVFRYILHVNGTEAKLYLVTVEGGGAAYGIEYDAWTLTFSDEECGDPLTLTFDTSGAHGAIGFGCTENTASEVEVELPP